jgi:hypothetical protein
MERMICCVMKTSNEKHITHFIRSICGNKTKGEQKQAELNFLRFITLAEKINDRLEKEKSMK